MASMRSIVAFAYWAKANGFRVGEFAPWTTVHNVHIPGSYHFQRGEYRGVSYSKAADINWGPPGATSAEYSAMQRKAIPVARSMGLSVIYALHGTVGSAGSHKDHLHVDLGIWSNLGRGAFRTTDGDLVAYDVQGALNTPSAERDNLFGPKSRKRFNAVRMASNYHKRKFPYGVKYTQRVVKTNDDGRWGVKSKAAHDLTVKRVQLVLKRAGFYNGEIDGRWGRKTEAAYKNFLNKYGR